MFTPIAALVSLIPFDQALVTRDACTVTSYSQVANGVHTLLILNVWTEPCLPAVASCTSIIINAITVPAGTTLDLTKLKSGTKVTFSGTTTFAHSNWAGPLISVAGTGITIEGSGTLDGLGAQYWDGQGGNGGVSK
jgi:hypothetical protein